MPSALEQLGLEVASIKGDEVFVRCPYHLSKLGREDRDAGSFSVNLETGASFCFSCRGGTASFAGLVAHMGRGSYEDALVWVVGQGLAPVRTTAQRAKPERIVTEADLSLFDPPPAAELDARKLDREAVEHYGVHWDTKRARWVLPIRDLDGALLGWQEKGDVVRNRPKGVNKAETLFGGHVFAGERIIIVESPLDAVRLRAADVEGAVATFGAAVSPQQVRMVIELANEVILALDDDEPGRQASRDLAAVFRQHIHTRALDYTAAPGAKDPGDMTDSQCRTAIDNAKVA